MNEWNKSDWFKTWLALAREGQNEMTRPDAQEAEHPLNDRQISRWSMDLERIPAAQWEVAE